MFDSDNINAGGGGATGAGNLGAVRAMQMQMLQMWAGTTASPTGVEAANDGAAVTMPGSGNQGWTWASSSPAFETLVAASSTNSTSTIIHAGLTANGLASNVAAATTTGFFFEASSTASTGNWYAVAGEVATTLQYTDTGIASASTGVSAPLPIFQRLRIKVVPNPTNASEVGYFYINDALVATITVTAPSVPLGMMPIVSIGKINAGNAVPMYVSYIRAWSDLIPGQNN